MPSPADRHPANWSISDVRSAVESILLVVDTPVPVHALAHVLDAETTEVRAALEEWGAELDQRGSGIELRENDEGWRLYTRRENAAAVEKFLLDGSHTRLSRAAMETLAIVAYRQPVTRSQIAAIRGVNVDGVVRTLASRGLVRECGAEPTTGAHLYETTNLFLELLGITSLSELPELAPLLPDVEIIDETF